jgi:diaminopimelate decarboxylase/aspartate kinase
MFGRERVHLISQSSNDLNLTFVVDEAAAEGMLPRLHAVADRQRRDAGLRAAVFGPAGARSTVGDPAAPRRRGGMHPRAPTLLELARKRHAALRLSPADGARTRARQLKAMAAVDRRFYAIKANPHPVDPAHAGGRLRPGMRVAGRDASMCSPVAAGLDPKRVLFTPNFAPRASTKLALAMGVNVTARQRRAAAALAGAVPRPHRVAAHRPGLWRGHHDKVNTGGRKRSSACRWPTRRIPRRGARAGRMRVTGLHAHLGSGITDPTHWRDVLGQLAAAAEAIGTVAAINIGGGIGVPPEPEAESFDVDAFARALGEARAAIPHTCCGWSRGVTSWPTPACCCCVPPRSWTRAARAASVPMAA